MEHKYPLVLTFTETSLHPSIAMKVTGTTSTKLLGEMNTTAFENRFIRRAFSYLYR